MSDIRFLSIDFLDLHQRTLEMLRVIADDKRGYWADDLSALIKEYEEVCKDE